MAGAYRQWGTAVTFAEAVRKLEKAGIPSRWGSRHVVFYPPNQAGTLVIPVSNKECSKQMKMLVEKVLAGRSQSRSGFVRNKKGPR